MAHFLSRYFKYFDILILAVFAYVIYECTIVVPGNLEHWNTLKAIEENNISGIEKHLNSANKIRVYITCFDIRYTDVLYRDKLKQHIFKLCSSEDLTRMIKNLEYRSVNNTTLKYLDTIVLLKEILKEKIGEPLMNGQTSIKKSIGTSKVNSSGPAVNCTNLRVFWDEIQRLFFCGAEVPFGDEV